MDKAKVGDRYFIEINEVPKVGALAESDFQKALLNFRAESIYAIVGNIPGFKVEGVLVRRRLKLHASALVTKYCSGEDRLSFCDQAYFFFPQHGCKLLPPELSRKATVYQLRSQSPSSAPPPSRPAA